MKQLCKIIVFLFFSFAITHLSAQEEEKEKNWSLNGHVNFIQTVVIDDYWLTDNLFNNRLKFEYYPIDNFKFVAEGRNRLAYGPAFALNPMSDELLENDDGFFNLSKNIASNQTVALNSQIDRLYFNYTHNKLEVTAGRQRINWARSIVWNPNDIFSSYSFFDISYPERAGSDALLFTYYTSEMSQADIATSINSNDTVTVAGRYKFNVKNIDIQLIGSYHNQSDIIAGAGFEGYLKDYSIRGEASYIAPTNNNEDKNAFVSSLAIDRIFGNQLSIQAEWLFNSYATPDSLMSFAQFYTTPFSVKTLSFDKHSLFVRAGYPLTPLVNIGLSNMYYFNLKGLFIMPNIDISLKDNMDMNLSVQYFTMSPENAENIEMTYAFWGLKYSF